MPGVVSTRPLNWRLRRTNCAVPVIVDSQVRRTPLSLLRPLPPIQPFGACSARVKRDPRLTMDLIPKCPNVVHELTRNSPLMPRVDPVIPTLQTGGGMSGMLILSLRKNLARAKFLAVQQRPRSTGWLLKPVRPRLPWDFVDSPSEPGVVHNLFPVVYQAKQWVISGVTKDSTGAILGSCQVDLFYTANDQFIQRTTSNAVGYYEFRSASQPPTTHFVVAYKAGSPDVAGTTVNTLVGI